jgi:hypothetical protein
MFLVHVHQFRQRERRANIGIEDEEHPEVGEERVSDCMSGSMDKLISYGINSDEPGRLGITNNGKDHQPCPETGILVNSCKATDGYSRQPPT